MSLRRRRSATTLQGVLHRLQQHGHRPVLRQAGIHRLTFDKSEPQCQQYLRLYLRKRTGGHSQEAEIVTDRATGITFGNAGRYRHGSPLELTCHPKALVGRKTLYQLINLFGQYHRLLPYPQITKIRRHPNLPVLYQFVVNLHSLISFSFLYQWEREQGMSHCYVCLFLSFSTNIALFLSERPWTFRLHTNSFPVPRSLFPLLPPPLHRKMTPVT